MSESQCTDAFSEHNVQKNRYKDMVPCKEGYVLVIDIDIMYICSWLHKEFSYSFCFHKLPFV